LRTLGISGDRSAPQGSQSLTLGFTSDALPGLKTNERVRKRSIVRIGRRTVERLIFEAHQLLAVVGPFGIELDALLHE
jgi:hypothetical protein